ncbi:hypothetical protein N7463_009818 [Penicillium fimorum]|uniref:Uncharacterized protein n=1 Tax=Penicillium fimorum TaxID=1882269 RepID=A0A9W9XIP3_9EURO|nr:hypothetical protein N7463_009818 [Penicillium fimorum]
MARPSYNIPLDNSIPSYESGRDNRGYKWPQVSSAHPFSVPAADPSVSPNHLLYNHHLQRSSAPLAPNYWIPAVPSDLDLYLSSQDVIHHSLLEDIGTARPFPMEGVSPGPVTTTGSASPSSDCSIQEIPQPKVNGHRGAKAGMSFQRRGARKQNPGTLI